MSSIAERISSYRRFFPLIAVALFLAAIWVLHDALRQFHYHHLLTQLKTIPASRIAASLGLTVASYLVLSVYDRLALAYIDRPLRPVKVMLTSFISYAFSNTIGLSLLTSASIRFRLYSTMGLSAEEIARLVAFSVLTFWLGIGLIAGLVFVAEPMEMPFLGERAFIVIRLAGLLLIVLVGAYLAMVARKTKISLFGKMELQLPSLPLATAQLAVGALDWSLAGLVLYVLFPGQAELSFFRFLDIYLLAQLVALISHVPGGLGVFESMVLLAAPELPADQLIIAMLIYRAIYYLLPLALAALLLAGHEILEKKALVQTAYRHFDRWWGAMIPHLLAITTFVSGTVLLFSGAMPKAPGRLEWLYEFLPLPVMEISHFLASLVGVVLLLLARGLQRRIDAAYVLAAISLGAGSLFSLLKGVDYEEAGLLGVMLAALLPCRRHFYRRASLLYDSLSLNWGITILVVLASSIWLGVFAYRHVDYSDELWWQFTLQGDAPRFLRAAVGSSVLLLVLTLARLLGPSAKDPDLPGGEELKLVRRIIGEFPAPTANLALLGDKALLFDPTGSGFVMYGVEGRAWVALGNPIGPPAVARELAWKFRELAERHSGQTVFYGVDTTMLDVYLDMGLTFFKLGENAIVPLTNFSLEGLGRKSLRYTYRHLTKEGCRFEVLPASAVPELLPELRRVSDDWLEKKRTREKSFSLGCFREDYLLNFPCAVVKLEDRIVAFANLWTEAGRQILSFDLMRFDSRAPRGIMEFLIISLMLWGKAEGYRTIDLGMAPLSGLESRSFAPLWNRIGSIIFRRGEQFYNFEGLREFKKKFNPEWQPRYLVCMGGFFTLPYTLVRTASLIGGGMKGVVAK